MASTCSVCSLLLLFLECCVLCRSMDFSVIFQKEETEEFTEHSTYEHINKSDDHFDAHMVDAGTQEQAKEAPAPADRQEGERVDEDMLDTPMEVTLSQSANITMVIA